MFINTERILFYHPSGVRGALVPYVVGEVGGNDWKTVAEFYINIGYPVFTELPQNYFSQDIFLRYNFCSTIYNVDDYCCVC